jgi:hypothetical protein
MATREKSEVEDKIKAQYKVIKAAGGVVVKDGNGFSCSAVKSGTCPKETGQR